MRRWLWLVAVLLLVGCSANQRKAGTGDVAFRLTWDGLSDLDLIVQDPSGDCIFFYSRQSRSGGILDVDCNAGTDFTCEHPIENVFWPKTTAPAGGYTFWVHAHALIPDEAPLGFHLQVLRGTEVYWMNADFILDHEEVHGPYHYDFPTGTITRGDPSQPLCAGSGSGVRTSR